MTTFECSLLLYLETCAVDYGGGVDANHVNSADMEILERWNVEGFVQSGRIAFHDVERMYKRSKGRRRATLWAELSEEAWAVAHEERRARATRMSVVDKRGWQKAGEG
jgi:hypothetical protein